MTVLQLTRDSVDPEDEVRAPHVVAAHLADGADLRALGEWLLGGTYLPPLADGATWVLRLASRAGQPVAVLTQEDDGSTAVAWVADCHQPLRGVGSLHLSLLTERLTAPGTS